MKKTVIQIEDHKIALANPDKVLYPAVGFTKAQVVEYYRRIAPYILPHLKDRALTFKRYPEGVKNEFFYEKRCMMNRPTWVNTATIPVENEAPIDYCMVNNLETLVWVENLASLELHLFLAKGPTYNTPDFMVFDLDPGEGANILDCGRVALTLRDLLLELKLESFIKTSGNKGLHVFVPLNNPETTFDQTKTFTKLVAATMQKHYPGLVTSKMAKPERTGKVFINWSQNDAAKSMVSVYSLRAREKPFASCPLEWSEVKKCVQEKNADGMHMLYSDVLRRLGEKGDLFREVLVKKQQLSFIKSQTVTTTAEEKKEHAPTETTELREYVAKRKFEKTPEPGPAPAAEGSALRFVVHKHAARRLHYDLRLEMGGVLKSWAVPKGPSLEPLSKRIAVMVEDHPLDYKDFEGVIPEGNYGAGSVIIWDRGYYHSPAAKEDGDDEELLLDGLHKGDLKFVLHGEKLDGEFALVKRGKEGKEWLLLKKKDRAAKRVDVLQDNRSVVSHKTLEEMLQVDSSKGFKEKKLRQIHAREALEKEGLSDELLKPMPKNVQPMLSTLVKKPFDNADWVFEVKWDGYRAIAEIEERSVSLYSRKGISFNNKYPLIVDALKKLGFDAVLDGEIVAVNDKGHPDFQMLQHYRESKGYLIYYVFDLLYYEGHDLTGLPLLKRKEILKKVLPASARIRLSSHVPKDGVLFFDTAREKGLEGIIAKRADSTYQVGKRSNDWLKIKSRRTQEGIMCGFTEPRGSRPYFGGLVLGVYENNVLTYIGHVGGGFSEQTLKEVYEKLTPLVQKECPFKQEPDTNTPATWVKPELVCEVSITEFTYDGMMRQPLFLRMRDDKDPREVIREIPKEPEEEVK